jgi:hypothetical protein
MIANALSHFAASTCSGSSFFGLPTWYMYLPSTTVNGVCTPQVTSLSDIWLIVAAGIEILLRLAGIIAFGFIIFAGFSYLTSQGEPDKTAKALNALISAVVGLAIAIMAATVVGFIAGSIK